MKAFLFIIFGLLFSTPILASTLGPPDVEKVIVRNFQYNGEGPIKLVPKDISIKKLPSGRPYLEVIMEAHVSGKNLTVIYNQKPVTVTKDDKGADLKVTLNLPMRTRSSSIEFSLVSQSGEIKKETFWVYYLENDNSIPGTKAKRTFDFGLSFGYLNYQAPGLQYHAWGFIPSLAYQDQLTSHWKLELESHLNSIPVTKNNNGSIETLSIGGLGGYIFNPYKIWQFSLLGGLQYQNAVVGQTIGAIGSQFEPTIKLEYGKKSDPELDFFLSYSETAESLGLHNYILAFGTKYFLPVDKKEVYLKLEGDYQNLPYYNTQESSVSLGVGFHFR